MKANTILSADLMLAILVSVACGESDKGEGPAEKAGATMGKANDPATEQASRGLNKAEEALKSSRRKRPGHHR